MFKILQVILDRQAYEKLTATDELQQLKHLQLITEEDVNEYITNKFSILSGGLRLKKLRGYQNIYSARIDNKSRFLLTFLENGDEVIPYVFNIDTGHVISKMATSELWQTLQSRKLKLGDSLVESYFQVQLAGNNNIALPADNPDIGNPYFQVQAKPVIFDVTQSDGYQRLIASSNQSHFVTGTAGSGKTLLMLNYLAEMCESDPEKKVLYLVKSEHLAKTQAKEFAKLYPDLVGRVEFTTQAKFLAARLQQEIQQDNIAKYENFLAWYNDVYPINHQGNRKYEEQGKTKFSPKNPLDVYYEFCHLAGNFAGDENKYKNAGSRDCLYQNKLEDSEENSSASKKKLEKFNRDDVIKLYRQYQEYLATIGLFDPINIALRVPDDEAEKFAAIAVDEAQLWTRKETEILDNYLPAGRHIQYAGDVCQGPSTFLPGYLAAGQDKTPTILRLETNYRSSEAVIAFAGLFFQRNKVFNDLLSISKATGSVKDDYNIKSGSDENGSLSFITIAAGSTIENHFGSLREDIIARQNDYMIVVPDQATKQAVIEYFAKSDISVFVMTASECQGMEYSIVILYKCLPKDLDISITAKTRDDVDPREVNLNRQLFLAASRSFESTIVIGESLPFIRHAQSLLKKYEPRFEQKPEAISPLGIIANSIKAAVNIFSYGNESYQEKIKDAIEQIFKLPENANQQNKEQLLERLKNFIETNHEFLKEEQQICEAILAGGNIDEILENITAYEAIFSNQIEPRYIAKIDPNLDFARGIVVNLVRKNNEEALNNLLQGKECSERSQEFYCSMLQSNDLSSQQLYLLLNFAKPDTAFAIQLAKNTSDNHKNNVIIDYLLTEKNIAQFIEYLKSEITKLTLSPTENKKGKTPTTTQQTSSITISIPFLDVSNSKQLQQIWYKLIENPSQNLPIILYLINNYHQKLFSDDQQTSEMISAIKIPQKDKWQFLNQLIEAFDKINPQILEIKDQKSQKSLSEILLEDALSDLIKNKFHNFEKNSPALQKQIFNLYLKKYQKDHKFGSFTKLKGVFLGFKKQNICTQQIDQIFILALNYGEDVGFGKINSDKVKQILDPNNLKEPENRDHLIYLISAKNLNQGIKTAVIEGLKQTTADGFNSLYMLAENHGNAFVKLLLSQDLDEEIKTAVIKGIKQSTTNRFNSLSILAKKDGNAFVKLLLSQDLDEEIKTAVIEGITTTTDRFNSLYMLAENHGNAFVKLLLSQDLDQEIKTAVIEGIKQSTKDGFNTLFFLALNRSDTFVKILLSKNFDQEIKTAVIEGIKQTSTIDRFNSLYMLATEDGDGFVKLLLSEDLDEGIKTAVIECIKQTTKDGFNPLFMLAENHGNAFVKLLLSQDLDQEIKTAVIEGIKENTKEGNSLSILTEKNGNAFVKLLLSKDLDKEIKTAVIDILKIDGQQNPIAILKRKNVKEFSRLEENWPFEELELSALLTNNQSAASVDSTGIPSKSPYLSPEQKEKQQIFR